MTYTEFRETFDSKEEFLKSLGLLSEDEIRKLIENENTSITVKVNMITTWQQAKSKIFDVTLQNDQSGE